jgi:cytoskeleton protein RodZ
MNEEVQSVGATLKTAREAQGLGLEQAAGRLRLMVRQLTAMEADDFPALGPPVFARGFVRNYARILGLDAEALVSRMAATGMEEPHTVEHVPLEPPSSLLTSPWVLGAVATLVMLIAIPVTLYLWLNSGDEPPQVNIVPVHPITEPVKPAVPAPAPAPAPVTAAPLQLQPLPQAVPAPEPPIAALPTPAPTPTAAPTAPPPPPPTDNADQTEMGAPATRGTIRLDFEGDAWMEINEESGRVLLHKLNPAGSSVTLTGTPPFSFIIGNAAEVRMTYNGRPLDLTPYIDVKVARFNLEE